MNPMRSTTSIICAALVVGSASSHAEEDTSVLRFANEDRISGKFLELNTDHVSWSAPWLEQPAKFDLSRVLDVTLQPNASIPMSDHVAVLQLDNGDVARGQLSSITDDSIELDTWYAGKIAFNRLMVESIEIEDSGPTIYRGPSSDKGWIQSESPGSWKYSRSSFISKAPGSIAMKDILPDECSISFKAQRKGSDFNMKVVIFSDRPEAQNPTSGYELSFRRTSCYLRKGTNSKYIGRARVPEINQNEQYNIEIRASRKSGKVALLVDGRLAEVWTDTQLKEGRFGNSLNFVTLNSLPTRISNITIKNWDGEIDEVPDNAPEINRFQRGMVPPAPEPDKNEAKSEDEENRMKLANGDSIVGEVITIDNGIATLNTPLGEISVPVARMRTMALSNLGQSECRLEPGDIRASFSDGTSLVFYIDDISNGTITGRSQNFGTNSKHGSAKFDINSMERIEFNIHEPDYKAIRAEDSW